MARPGTERDHAFMLRALALAERGWGSTAPNPLVGAVVVQGGRVVGEGWHARYGGDHAEVAALASAGEAARGATVYVTLEPCAHWGKTPPCTRALIAAGVARVVAAVADPSPGAAGGGEALRAAGVAYDVGVEAQAARRLNAAFFRALAADRPFVTLKLALSGDAAVAPASREPRRLTGCEADREVHRLRAGSDGVAVGIGTALADDPDLTVRHWAPPRVPPVRIVFDREARLPLESRLVRTASRVPTWVVAERPQTPRRRALEAAGVRVLRVPPGLDGALDALRALEVRALLVEGGARLAASLLAAGVVDRLIIFHTPAFLGAGAISPFADLSDAVLQSLELMPPARWGRFGADLMMEFDL